MFSLNIQRMQETFEGNFDLDTDKFLALDKLCPTCWTVRVSYLKRSLTTTVYY